MKKSSIGLLLLSVLICLSMLLASCSNKNSKTNDTVAPTEGSTADSTPEAVTADASAALEKWNQYLTFASPIEEKSVISTSNLKFSHYNNGDESLTSRRVGNFYIVTRTDYDYYYGSYSTPVATAYHYTVYSAKSGAQIFTRSLYLDSYTSWHNPTCSFAAISADGYTLPLLEVRESYYDESYEETIVSYSYYNEDGEAIVTKLSEKVTAKYNSQDNTATVELNGKIYVYNLDGEYIFTFNKGEEKLIPSSYQEFGDLYYVFSDNSVYVFDTSYNKLCEYTENTALSSQHYILSDGNLLYTYDNIVSKDASHDLEADYGYDDGYYNAGDYQAALCYIKVDAKTGKTTELKADFVICDMLTEANKETSGISFKDTKHQLAVIRKIENGILSNDKITAIIDSELAIVEELPVFIKAQSNVYKMLDANKLLIASENYNQEQLIYHTVDINEKTVDIFVNTKMIDKSITNGFIVDDKLYNFDIEEVMDLSNCTNYKTYGDYLIVEDGDTYLCYISNGEVVKHTIINGDGSYQVYGDIILVTDLYETSGDEYSSSWSDAVYKVYNTRGTLLKEFTNEVPSVTVRGDGYAWIKTSGDTDYADIYYLK